MGIPDVLSVKFVDQLLGPAGAEAKSKLARPEETGILPRSSLCTGRENSKSASKKLVEKLLAMLLSEDNVDW